MNIRRWPLVLGLVATLFTASAMAQPAADRNAALDHLSRGTASFQAGDIPSAAAEWQQTIAIARQIGAFDLAAQALVRRGEAYRVIGHLTDAATDLRAAVTAAGQSGDQALIAAAAGALGSVELTARHPDAAEKLLLQSRDLARQIGDRATLAASSNDLGNLYAAANRLDEAGAAYNEAIASAAAAGDDALAATGEINAARLDRQRNNPAGATALLTRAVNRIEKAPPSYNRGLVLVSAGSTVLDQTAGLSADQQQLAQRAFAAAGAMAQTLRSAQLTSLAQGGLGRLDARIGRPAPAQANTDRALFAAQQAAAPELSFRFEWQQAKLERQQGQTEAALASYRRAVAALQSIRQDIPVEYRDGRSSYRVTFGPLYMEFADLLLQQARRSLGEAPALVREARDTIEALKESELQDYYRDSCVANFEARKQSIDTVAPGAAVLYPISLPDRLELLVSIGQEQHQVTIPVPAATLKREVQQFRELLEKRTTNEYLGPAQLIYTQVIRPIEPLLSQNRIDTLVVVPDDIFRIIPFAALHDGQHFLVDRYATAIAPSLHLIAPRPLSQTRPVALVLGISNSVDGFVGLPNVPREVAAVHQIEGGQTLMDAAFTRGSFGAELKDNSFNVVHIASHGKFGDNPSHTYLLAYDGPLTMDDLETDIKYGQNRQNALELLVLSACETATGDDRAALGLAGVALKAGARSAVASLWYISDQASQALVTKFYTALRQPGISKARALQAAQRELKSSLQYAHPAYWAPFLLIGNWL